MPTADASQGRLTAAIIPAAFLAALLAGLVSAVEPKFGLAVVAAAGCVGLALVGFPAIFAAWTVAFFIPFYGFGNVLLKAGLVLVVLSVPLTAIRDWPAIRARLRAAAPFLIAATALFAWLALSVLWAPATGTAVSAMWKYGISISIFVALIMLLRGPGQVRLVVAAFVFGAALTALCALLGFSGGTVNSLPGEGRLQGGTGDPNVLGAAVIAGIVLAAGLLKGTRRTSVRILLLGAIVIFGLAAAGTGSRGGTIAALAALVAALAVMRDERRAVLGVAFTAAIVGAIWLSFSPGSMDRLTSFGDRGDGRGDLWRVAWEMGAQNPVHGVGLENFIPSAPDYVLEPGAISFIHLITEKPVVVHNTYLQFFAETGVVGLLLFLILVVLSLSSALKAASLYQRAGQADFAHLCRCVFVAAVALLVASFFISAGVDYKLWAVLALGPATYVLARGGAGTQRRVAPAGAAAGTPGRHDADAPRVAVVVPCFNDGSTIEATLESLRGGERCEVVVVDDGSDDPDTLAALDRLRVAGTTVLSQENRGLSAARMRGVEATTAPYIQPLDADDFIVASALGPLADLLDEDPGLAVVWGDQRTFGELAFTQRRAPSLDPWAITYVNRLTAGLIRREALVEAGGWVLEIGYEDWDLWMGLAERGWRGRRLDATTYLYRISSSRMLSGARSHHDDLYAQMRARHQPLFRGRRSNWRRSSVPLRVRLLLPLVRRLPLDELARHRLYLLISEPVHAARVRLARRRGGGIGTDGR